MAHHMQVRWHDDIAILTPRGYLMGGDETDTLAATIDKLFGDGNRKLLIDLIETAHMNSVALGLLVRSHHRYQEAGGHVRLCHLTDRIENALVITRLSMVFDQYETERAAIEAFETPTAS